MRCVSGATTREHSLTCKSEVQKIPERLLKVLLPLARGSDTELAVQVLSGCFEWGLASPEQTLVKAN